MRSKPMPPHRFDDEFPLPADRRNRGTFLAGNSEDVFIRGPPLSIFFGKLELHLGDHRTNIAAQLWRQLVSLFQQSQGFAIFRIKLLTTQCFVNEGFDLDEF